MDCLSGCVKKSNTDDTFHGLLSQVSAEMGAEASLFDIPTLYNPGIPKKAEIMMNPDSHVPGTMPVHTLCEYEPKLPLFFMSYFGRIYGLRSNCTALWNDYITNVEGSTNPYLIPEDNQLGKCSHGIGSVAK